MAGLPPELFPEHRDGEITPFAQATLYPYPVPDGDFVMEGGLPRPAPGGIEAGMLRGRMPVLSVGSNRSPLQLRRKFGTDSVLPVTTAVLRGVDVVFASLLSYYCAVPATGFPCQGAAAHLNIAWLDETQLAHMHETEARGVAYDFIRYHPGAVDHGDHGARRDRDDAVFEQPVHGYEARAGVLGFDGQPVAHAAIACDGRVFAEMEEQAMLERVRALLGPEAATLEEWVMAMRDSREAREGVMRAMEPLTMKPENAPWDIVEGSAGAPESYL